MNGVELVAFFMIIKNQPTIKMYSFGYNLPKHAVMLL